MKCKLYQHYSLYGFSNSYILGNDETGEALVVDPGDFTVAMLNHIEKNGYRIVSVLLSHTHVHHIRGIKTLLKIYDAAIYTASARVFGRPCRVVRDGERFETAGFTVEAYSVPGHSPDSVAYRIAHLLFTGDALHAGLIGKTLSPFNARLLAESVRAKFLGLSDETLVLPGHGPPSTIGSERRSNIGLEEGWAERIRTDYDFFV